MCIVITTFKKQLKQECYERNNVSKENTEWEKDWIKIMNNRKPERGMKDI